MVCFRDARFFTYAFPQFFTIKVFTSVEKSIYHFGQINPDKSSGTLLPHGIHVLALAHTLTEGWEHHARSVAVNAAAWHAMQTLGLVTTCNGGCLSATA